MADENVITIKDRKLFYDPYNRGYYFESKIEALERATSNRYKKADALNKNISLQSQSANRHIDQAEHIFTAKCIREIGELRESLRGHVAYRKVLNQAAKDFELSPKNIPPGKYGTYGEGYQKELMPQIESELKQMNPEMRRRKEVKRLLRQRKKPEVFDRTLPDDLLILTKKRRNKSASDVPNSIEKAQPNELDGQATLDTSEIVLPRRNSDERIDERSRPGKLVLPPIQATMSPTKSRSLSNESNGNDATVTLPSVFVTELDKLEEESLEETVMDKTRVEGGMGILD